jgi:hypothetical protein
MQTAEVVLGVLRERGRQGLPLTQLYRQMFNRDLYLLAYGNIYSNQGAMQGFVKVAGGVQPGERPVRSRNCRAWRGSCAQRRVSAV